MAPRTIPVELPASAIPTNSGLDFGDTTVDELFLHWYPGGRIDFAVGRMQTRFVARGGVYAKSLDRNDGHNIFVTWTDGFHGTIRARKGWVSHLIIQTNREDGSGSITVEKVGGSVTIDDGSGGIDVNDVELDLVIVDDGSGGLDATNIRGDVINDG